MFIPVGSVVPVVALAGCIVGVALSPKNCKKNIFSAPCTSLVLARKHFAWKQIQYYPIASPNLKTDRVVNGHEHSLFIYQSLILISH